MRLALVLPLLLVAACGSSEPPTPQAMADKLGCTGYAPATTEEVFVQDVGTCTFEGKRVRLLTFIDNEARDGFVRIASSFGGKYVPVEAAAYEAEDTAAAAAIRAKVG